MTNITTIPQGSDITAAFTLTDSDGVALNLNSFAGIAVFLYRCGNKKIIKQYSKVVSAGFSTLSVVNAANGEFEIYIPRSLTKNLKKDELRAEVKLRRVDVDGESSAMYSVATDIVVSIMQEAVASEISVP